ncbi:MAG: O-acetylhomoserine aminocarboxypropyltransferase/cysteine synthase [Bacteroidaceae bacterium]|nr:O-acetylhomoserine aminocarboxypropyltransferase/cysteine synthase [Bacteroidaceae bacterium]
MAQKKLHFETLQLHVGQEQADPTTDSRAVPIYQTTSYVFHNSQHAADRFGLRDAGNIYGRLTNSTQAVFEDRVAALEGGVAGLAVASGAAAVTYALQNIAQAGDHIVAADNLYGGSFNLITHTLTTQGITNTIININDLAALEAAIQPNTKAIYAETFGNPNSDVLDIEAVAEVAHRHHVPLIIDNTFGTPYLIRPIEHGADIVVHSATKFLGGHGSSLGGVIVDGGTFDWKANAAKFPTLASPDPSYHGAVFADVAGAAAFVTRIRAVILRDTGAAISPFNAWILLQGLETLSLRVERHVENALKVVDFLAAHPKVAHVNHPSLPSHPDHLRYQKYFPNGGGSIFTFEIQGGQEAAWKFIDSLSIFSLLANVADVKSLVIHPYTTTHSQLSPEELAAQHITPATIRLSIGTEHIDDILDDLKQALEKI